MTCQSSAAILAAGGNQPFATAEKDLTAICDITRGGSRSQIFTADRTGMLQDFMLSCFKSGYPSKGLSIEFSSIADAKTLYATTVVADSISWSPKNLSVQPRIMLQAGKTYQIKIINTADQGLYGLVYYPKEKDSADRKFLFQPHIRRRKK